MNELKKNICPKTYTIGFFFSCKDENYDIPRKMGRTRDQYIKGSKPNLERQTLHVFFRMQNLDLNSFTYMSMHICIYIHRMYDMQIECRLGEGRKRPTRDREERTSMTD